MPGQGISGPREDKHGSIIDTEDHKLHRTGVGVGILLYLVNHLRPDISNVVRELSKVLDGPTEAVMKELKIAILILYLPRGFLD
jgi:hypothetical protein